MRAYARLGLFFPVGHEIDAKRRRSRLFFVPRFVYRTPPSRYEATAYHPVTNGTDDWFGRPHVVVDRTMVCTRSICQHNTTQHNTSISVLYLAVQILHLAEIGIDWKAACIDRFARSRLLGISSGMLVDVASVVEQSRSDKTRAVT